MSDPYTTPEPTRSALLTIDVQNDFTRTDAPARVPGTLEAIPAMQEVVGAFRTARRPIIHVIRLYQADGANVDACRRRRIEDGASIVRPGTDGAELVAALRPDAAPGLDAAALLAGRLQPVGETEWVMYKPRWSAFYDTGLDLRLRALGVTTLVVCGCNFPNCPRSTIYDGSNHDYRIVVVEDAISGLYDRGLEELRGIGVETMPAAQVARWLGADD